MKQKLSRTIVDDKRDVDLLWDSLAQKHDYVPHAPGDGGYTVKEWARRKGISQRSAGDFLLAQHRAGILDRYDTLQDNRKAALYYPKGHKVVRR